MWELLRPPSAHHAVRFLCTAPAAIQQTAANAYKAIWSITTRLALASAAAAISTNLTYAWRVAASAEVAALASLTALPVQVATSSTITALATRTYVSVNALSTPLVPTPFVLPASLLASPALRQTPA